MNKTNKIIISFIFLVTLVILKAPIFAQDSSTTTNTTTTIIPTTTITTDSSTQTSENTERSTSTIPSSDISTTETTSTSAITENTEDKVESSSTTIIEEETKIYIPPTIENTTKEILEDNTNVEPIIINKVEETIVPPLKQNVLDINNEKKIQVISETQKILNQINPRQIERNKTSIKIKDLGNNVDKLRTTIKTSKEELRKIVDQNIADIVNKNKIITKQEEKLKIEVIRNEIIKEIDSSLVNLKDINTDKINNLKVNIDKKIENIKSITAENTTDTEPFIDTSLQNITEKLDTLSKTVNNQSRVLKDQGIDLLYKDTNKDGISDYDSINIYNIDPIKPSPVSTHEGRDLNAVDKIILGFDPSKVELVKIEIEEPEESVATIVDIYKVKEIELNETKEVVIKGQALPNSFVTLYIYSTPIIVTVKTDDTGQWQYTLDKELEDGNHTVYTATVNNTGNIIAKSSPYFFTKTAEAITLENFPLLESSTNIQEPKFWDNDNFYYMIIFIMIMAIIILIIVGLMTKKTEEELIKVNTDKTVINKGNNDTENKTHSN